MIYDIVQKGIEVNIVENETTGGLISSDGWHRAYRHQLLTRSTFNSDTAHII